MEKRLLDIQKRMSEIAAQIEELTGEALDAAIKEVDDLKAEKAEIEKRMSLSENIEKRSRQIVTPADKKSEITEKTYGIDSEEYRSAYLKDLQGKKLTEVEQRAMTTASESNGAVVPTLTMNKIVEKLRDAGVLLPFVTTLGIPSNVILPVEDTTADLAWKSEGTASTDSDDKVGKVELTYHKLIKTITITAELENMSIDAFEGFLINMLVKKVKVALDNAILNGSGSGQATGILNTITPIDPEEAGKIKYNDIISIIANLRSGYDAGAMFVMHKKTLYNQIAKIKDTTQKPIFKMETDGRFRGNLLGYPVLTCEYVPENEVILGNFEYYYLNISKPFEVAKDRSVAFKSGDICYRVLGLVDGKVALNEAFVVMDANADTAG